MHDHVILYPLQHYGLIGKLFSFDYSLMILVLWSAGITICIGLSLRLALQFRPSSFLAYCIEKLGQKIEDFIIDTIGFSNKTAFTFIMFLLFFIMICNLLVLIPHLEEPTNNINVTLALALFSFFYIHRITYLEERNHYWSHWFKMPFSIHKTYFKKKIIKFIEQCIRIIINVIIALCALPIEIISRAAVLLSLSFRLFGNMFAGAILNQLAEGFLFSSVLYHIMGTIIGIGIFLKFFALFEGIIQSGIFILISLNNIAIMLGDRDH